MYTWTTKKAKVFNKWELVKEFNVPIYYAEADEDWAKSDCLFHFRENRNYRLPEDLDFWSFGRYDQFLDYEKPNEDDYDYEDWLYYKDKFEEMTKKLDEEYYWQWLDWYEHSAISISIAWTWMQCRRDTSNNVWIVAIPKKYFEWEEAEKKAMEYLKNAVNDFSDWMNGWVYEFWITEEVEFTNPEHWSTYKDIPIDDVESGWYTMSMEDKYMEKDIEDNIKMICKNRWIEFDEIKIEG